LCTAQSTYHGFCLSQSAAHARSSFERPLAND
jgi:hypothetical protein